MFPLSLYCPDMFVHPLLRSDGLSAAHPLTPRFARRREGLPRRRAAQGRADELPAETVRMCRLRMVVALERVGHSLSDAIPGLEAAQKTSPGNRTRLPTTPTSSGYTGMKRITY